MPLKLNITEESIIYFFLCSLIDATKNNVNRNQLYDIFFILTKQKSKNNLSKIITLYYGKSSLFEQQKKLIIAIILN